jgi:AmiR/NasT family two-component response regulator
MRMRIPNFRGQRVLLLHPRDRNCEAMVEQLEKLGVSVGGQWPAAAVSGAEADAVLFDSDLGFDGLFAWSPGAAPVPLIAIMGSEAPGRIEWTLTQEPSAYLLKPIGSTGVFTALSIAFHNFGLKQARDRERIEVRLERSGAVVLAVATLMRRYDVDAETAFRMLRVESMRRRTTLVAMSGLVRDGKWLPSAPPVPTSGSGRKRSSA